MKHVVARAEEALRESEERYRTLIDAVREIICTVAPDGRFLSFNPALTTLTGWSAGDWIGRQFAEIVHPDDVGACTHAFEAALRGEAGPTVRHRLRMRDGGWLSVESTGAPLFRDGRVAGVLGLVRDVTERVRAEEAQCQSRSRLDALFQNALDAILLIDDEARYVDANAAATELLGYSREELLALTAADVIPAGWEDEAGEAVRAFAERGRYAGDYRVRRKDGTVRDADFRSVANILPGLHLAIARDVTDRKRAEEQLRRSARRLEDAEAVAHLGSWEWNPATGDLVWTDELYRIFGLAPGSGPVNYDDVVGRLHPADRAPAEGVFRKAVTAGGEYALDVRIVRPEGEERVVHARGHAIRNPEGRVERVIGIVQDITDRTRNAQTQRALVHRVLTIQEEERARLSRELHDGTGQALTALLVGLRRLEDAPTLQGARLVASRLRELVAQTMNAVGRLARGIRPAVLDDIGLRAALDRHASDQAAIAGFRISVDAAALGRKRLPPEIETALYRAAQEALANAARHASPTAVCITLRRAANIVSLTVSDDGCGFDAGQATSSGLGLHTVRERAELLGGRVEVRSAPGAGTTVRLEIPLPASPRRRAR